MGTPPSGRPRLLDGVTDRSGPLPVLEGLHSGQIEAYQAQNRLAARPMSHDDLVHLVFLCVSVVRLGSRIPDDLGFGRADHLTVAGDIRERLKVVEQIR